MTTQSGTPAADDVLEADGETCATLTPLIRASIGKLDGGSVLEVRTDDPAAREGVPAWSRLTGNELLSAVQEDDEHTRFYLRKK